MGQDDNTQGLLHLFGGFSEGAVGGELRIYNPSDYDTTIDYYSINSPADNADLYIGPNTIPNALRYDGTTYNRWISERDFQITGGDLYIGDIAF